MPAYLSRYSASHTLAAGAATPIDVPIDGAEDWLFLVKNTGANPVTACTVARSPLGALFEDAVAASTGIPLAAGATLPVEGTDAPVTSVRLMLTSASGTTVTVEGGGW
jgi:hypothetical protein